MVSYLFLKRNDRDTYKYEYMDQSHFTYGHFLYGQFSYVTKFMLTKFIWSIFIRNKIYM